MAANPRIPRREAQVERRVAPAPESNSSTDEPLESASIQSLAPGDAGTEMSAPEVIAVPDGCESRHEAVAKAAYFLSQARGFEPGHELDDWFLAEEQLGFR
jgi:hypothetical protein